MNRREKRALIDRYVAAYNAFDIDEMMSVIHSDIEFTNISDGNVNATASGVIEFRGLAEQAKDLFSVRSQTVTAFQENGDQAFTEVAYEAVLAADLSNATERGDTIRLRGRSEFTFRDRKIYRIVDIT